MTLLTQMPTEWLSERRDELLARSKEYMNTGRFKEFRQDCLRISKITSELNRRENKKRTEWRNYV